MTLWFRLPKIWPRHVNWHSLKSFVQLMQSSCCTYEVANRHHVMHHGCVNSVLVINLSACRRLGYPKWPRRDLLKAARQQNLEQESQRPLQDLLQSRSSPSMPDLGPAVQSGEPSLQPIMTGSSPDFSFYGAHQSPPAQQSQPFRGESSGCKTSSATDSLPSSGVLDRSCSSSLDAAVKTSVSHLSFAPLAIWGSNPFDQASALHENEMIGPKGMKVITRQ